MRYKHKGVTLAATAIAIVAWMFLGYISFIVMASPFSVLAAVRTARQAEQYAEFVANSLKLVDYSELGKAAHARRSLTGEISGAAGWESRVVIGAEQQIGSNPDNLQRIATIDIFQTGDTLSRYTLQVPLSSAGSEGSIGFPDYSKATEWKYTTARQEQTFTAPENGFLTIHIWGNIPVSLSDTYVKINGRTVFIPMIGTTDPGDTVNTMILLSKGDKVTIKATENSYGSAYDGVYRAYLYFFPCKK